MSKIKWDSLSWYFEVLWKRWASDVWVRPTF